MDCPFAATTKYEDATPGEDGIRKAGTLGVYDISVVGNRASSSPGGFFRRFCHVGI